MLPERRRAVCYGQGMGWGVSVCSPVAPWAQVGHCQFPPLLLEDPDQCAPQGAGQEQPPGGGMQERPVQQEGPRGPTLPSPLPTAPALTDHQTPCPEKNSAQKGSSPGLRMQTIPEAQGQVVRGSSEPAGPAPVAHSGPFALGHMPQVPHIWPMLLRLDPHHTVHPHQDN